jgi:phage terminase large subunit-like protein
MIPAESLMDWSRRQGVADSLDSAIVKHVSGGVSTIGFKSYDQGRQKWQSETLDFVWFDEEPPMDIYMEGLTRTNATGGMTFITFTPLLGMSDVVSMFLGDE